MLNRKMNFRKIILIATLLLFVGKAFSQEGDSLNVKIYKPSQLKRFGKTAMVQGDYYAASAYYEEYLKYKPNNYKIAYTLAEAYRKSRDYEMAQKWYNTSLELTGGKDEMSMYYHALMVKMNGDCKKAKEEFGKFKKLASGKTEFEFYLKEIKNEILGCDSSERLSKNLAKVTVHRLDTSINKVNTENSPILLDNKTMMYSSLRTNKKLFKYAHPDSVNTNVRKLYKATRVGNDWSFAGELDGPFNQPEKHTAGGAYSVDKKRFYFSQCETNKKGKVICALFVSTKNSDGTWADPIKLKKEINNPKYTSTMPTVGTESSKGNEVVYFVSDRPDGKGGLDIWYTVYDFKKKSYSTPRNCGTSINTTSDETSPFFDQVSHSLYFSSAGLPGMGGLDVFRTRGELKKFGPADNIGSPINSSYDDLFYSEGEDHQEGFFVSNRKGAVVLGKNPTCCDDIYEFKRLEYIKIDLSGEVFAILDSTEKRTPISNAFVSIYMIDTRVPEPILIKRIPASDAGKYYSVLEPGFDYKITADAQGYMSGSGDLKSKDVNYNHSFIKDIQLIPLPKLNEVVRVKNIYYEFDKSDLTAKSKIVLDTTLYVILTSNPTLKIELGSHTDAKGSDDYNMKLSQARAESAVKYLISKGIAPERMVAKGYGESKPIAPNTHADGTDSPEGREKNRRTEFRVIGYIENTTILNEADEY